MVRTERTRSVSPRVEVDLPAVRSMDELAMLQDSELADMMMTLERDKSKVIAGGGDPRMWEEEIAYVKREIQIRYAREKLHDKYVKQLENEWADDYVDEADLPWADLDNSRFIYIA